MTRGITHTTATLPMWPLYCFLACWTVLAVLTAVWLVLVGRLINEEG